MIEGIRPQIILGLPWIQQEQPQVEWNDGAALVFPGGGRWVTGDLTEDFFWVNDRRVKTFRGMHLIDEEKPQTENEDTKKETAEWMKETLQRYTALFTPLTGIPPDDRVRHGIQLVAGARPVMKRPYRLSMAQKKDAEAQIKQYMHEGWIQPSLSA